MIENIGTIKNPLTIIAMFAGIAEISGTLVLPFINPENQSVYIWFLMIFPFLLIIIFFLTLNFNHRVLYAPSDYKDEDNFIKSLQKASYAEKALKFKEEIEEIEIIEPEGKQQSSSSLESKTSYRNLVKRSTQASYMLAEELTFEKLSKEFTSEIQREVKLDEKGNGFIFDGLVKEKGNTVAIEVKFLRTSSVRGIKHTIDRIIESTNFLPDSERKNFKILLVIVTDQTTIQLHKIKEQLHTDNYIIPIELRLYNLDELEKEFEVNL